MYRTPLHLAAAGGECTLVAELLAGGAAVGVIDPAGDTALHHGVAAAYLLEDERDLARAAEVVRSLLLCRAAPPRRTRAG